MEQITAQFATVENDYRRERLSRDVRAHGALTHSAWVRRRRRERTASVARHLRAA